MKKPSPKKPAAIVCAFLSTCLLLCSCEPTQKSESIKNYDDYGTHGVYNEHYGISDNGCSKSYFFNIMDVLFSAVKSNDERADRNYKNNRTAGDFVIGDYYSDNDEFEGVCILDYTGDSKDVVIPEQLDGEDVVALGAYDIVYNECLRLPFEKTGFRCITLPPTLKYIYDGALEFSDVVFLSEQDRKNYDITLPEIINVDPENDYFSSENGILYSKDKTCLLCVPANYKAEQLTLPDSVEYIAENAIVCENIKQLNISKNVAGINYPSFIFSKKLERINVAEQNKHYSSNNGVLFSEDRTVLLNYPSMKSDKRYTLPDSVDTVVFNWGNVLCTEEIIFNENIKECNLYNRPYAYSEYNAEGIAWYSSIKKVCGYRGTGFDEAIYNLRSLRDIDYEYLN